MPLDDQPPPGPAARCRFLPTPVGAARGRRGLRTGARRLRRSRRLRRPQKRSVTRFSFGRDKRTTSGTSLPFSQGAAPWTRRRDCRRRSSRCSTPKRTDNYGATSATRSRRSSPRWPTTNRTPGSSSANRSFAVYLVLLGFVPNVLLGLHRRQVLTTSADATPAAPGTPRPSLASAARAAKANDEGQVEDDDEEQFHAGGAEVRLNFP